MINVQRKSDNWEKITFSYSGSTNPSDLIELYDYSLWELQYSTNNGDTWQKDTTVTINSSFGTDISSTHTYSSQTQFLFRMKIKDTLQQDATSPNFSLPMGEPTMFIDVETSGVGINCFPQTKGLWIKTQYYNSTGSQWVYQDRRCAEQGDSVAATVGTGWD